MLGVDAAASSVILSYQLVWHQFPGKYIDVEVVAHGDRTVVLLFSSSYLLPWHRNFLQCGEQVGVFTATAETSYCHAAKGLPRFLIVE